MCLRTERDTRRLNNREKVSPFEAYQEESAFWQNVHGRFIIDHDSSHLLLSMMPEINSGLLSSHMLTYLPC